MAKSTPEPGREIKLFLLLTFLLSSVFWGLLFLRPNASEQWGVYSGAFMWCPGMAAIITQLTFRRSLRGLGWGWGGLRYYLLAYSLPIAFCFVAYLPVWVAFSAFNSEALHEAATKLGLPAGLIGNAGLFFLVAIQPLLGMIGSLGEEVGWRGFLVPRIYSFVGFTRTSLIIGLIWAIWHYPATIVIFPRYRPTVPIGYALACFTIAVMAVSFVHTWLRLRSGSMWPSTLLHAAGNAFMASFQALTKENATTAYLTFEYGIGLALVMLPLGYVFWRCRQTAAICGRASQEQKGEERAW